MAKKNNEKKKKKPKVTLKTLTITDICTYNASGKADIIPFIRLRGKWLIETGFIPKQKINVFVSQNLLIITPKEEEEI